MLTRRAVGGLQVKRCKWYAKDAGEFGRVVFQDVPEEVVRTSQFVEVK